MVNQNQHIGLKVADYPSRNLNRLEFYSMICSLKKIFTDIDEETIISILGISKEDLCYANQSKAKRHVPHLFENKEVHKRHM